MLADVAVGAGVLVGLALAGRVPTTAAVVLAVALGAAYVAFRNPFYGMALQAAAYGAFLWNLWTDRAPTRWLPVAVAGAIAVLDRRRLVRVVLPAFFGGVTSAARLRKHDSFRLPERPPPEP